MILRNVSSIVLSSILWLISMTSHGYSTFITVAQDGSGDFTSIQAAINATKAFPDSDITVFIKNGIYQEKVEVFSWNTHVKMIGESRDETIIRNSDFFDSIALGRNSTFHTYTLKVAGNDFSAANLTIENTAGPVGQAVALHVEADRAAFYNVTINGFQDSLYLAGEGRRSYFKDCHIEGSVDFIFGAGTAWFESCDIVSLRSDSYVTAASTPQNQTYGFVFNQCKFVAEPGIKNVYLGRPWRSYARTVVLNSELLGHIHEAGWQDWEERGAQGTVFYAEANNSGVGASVIARVAWSQQLNSQQLLLFKLENVLKGWQPIKPFIVKTNWPSLDN